MDEDAVDSDGEESEVQLDVLLKDMEQDDDPAGENSDEDDIIAIEDQGGLGEEAKQHDASAMEQKSMSLMKNRRRLDWSWSRTG